MMAKPIQDPTYGQHKQSEGTEKNPASRMFPEKEGSSLPKFKLYSSLQPIATLYLKKDLKLGKKAVPHLISIVGTGHQQKQPGEGVLGGVWNLPGFGPWHARQR